MSTKSLKPRTLCADRSLKKPSRTRPYQIPRLPREGRITGLVIDKYGEDLGNYCASHRDEAGTITIGDIDKERFLTAVEDAVRHLHSLGYAHNDLNSRNIMVNEDRLPVLVDFEACRKIGEKLPYTRGTEGWVNPEDDLSVSDACHDRYGLAKVREWMDNPETLL